VVPGDGKPQITGNFTEQEAKALADQLKYGALPISFTIQSEQQISATLGSEQLRVGLLTGDTSINTEAPVVVMTTEVLRNMLYSGSRDLDRLGFVVMDEVHYLADRFRGPVWEEVIIHLPAEVQVISLSATVSNAEEFGDWLGQVRGRTAVVVSEERPVPLTQHMMVGRRLLPAIRCPSGFWCRRNFDLLQGKRRGRGQSGCSVAMLRRRQIIAHLPVEPAKFRLLC